MRHMHLALSQSGPLQPMPIIRSRLNLRSLRSLRMRCVALGGQGGGEKSEWQAMKIGLAVE